MPSPVIWRPMDYFFIPAICSWTNTGMVHLSLFTDHGTGRPKNKKDISLFSSHSKTANRRVTGKYSQIILQVQKISAPLRRQCIVPADSPRDRMAHYMFRTMSKEQSIKSL